MLNFTLPRQFMNANIFSGKSARLRLRSHLLGFSKDWVRRDALTSIHFDCLQTGFPIGTFLDVFIFFNISDTLGTHKHRIID